MSKLLQTTVSTMRNLDMLVLPEPWTPVPHRDHPQNTPAASIPLRDSAKTELLLLLEQFLPSRAGAGVGFSLHPQSPSHRTSSPCQGGVTRWGLLPAEPALFISCQLI